MARRSTKALEEALLAGEDSEPSVEQQVQDRMPEPAPKKVAVAAEKVAEKTKEVEIDPESVRIRGGELDVYIDGSKTEAVKVTFHGKELVGVKRFVIEPRDGSWIVKMVLLDTESGGTISIVGP